MLVETLFQGPSTTRPSSDPSRSLLGEHLCSASCLANSEFRRINVGYGGGRIVFLLLYHLNAVQYLSRAPLNCERPLRGCPCTGEIARLGTFIASGRREGCSSLGDTSPVLGKVWFREIRGQMSGYID